MRSTFFGIEMARRALGAQRTNVDVIGHNLANAATEGYRKQEARLTPTNPYDQKGHPRMIMGTGVKVDEITRKQNRYLDREIYSRTSDEQMWSKRNQLLREVQDILAEPGEGGIGAAMDRFWNGWQELAGSADDPAVRTAVLERGAELGDAFHLALRQLDNMGDNLEQTIETRVDRINAIIGELREVNAQAVSLDARGLNPNDLLDRRDLLVEDLSGLIDVDVNDLPDGGVALTVDGIPILDSFSGRTLEIAEEEAPGDGDGSITFAWRTDDGSPAPWSPADGGEFAALVGMRNDEVPALRDDIAALSNGIRDAVNEQHREGFGLGGEDGFDFFDPDATSGYLRVNPQLQENPGRIAAALGDEEGNFTGPADGRNAEQIAQLRDEGILGEDDVTAGEYWRGMVANIGVRTEQAELLSNNNHTMLNQLKNQRDAVTGVSIDEELTHLIQAQSAFGAAARLVTVWDDMLDTVVNRMVR